MSKKVLIGVAAVLLILVVLIWQVIAGLDRIVAGVIENVGSDVLKTEVQVSDVGINLKEGQAGIGGLTVANPPGYSDAKLFDMEGIAVELQMESIGKEVLVIEHVVVKNPVVSFEIDESGGNNMQTLLDNMGGESAETTTEAEPATEDTEPAEAIKLIIDNFAFSGGTVNAITPNKPGEVTTINMPAINMQGIGRKQGGVTPDVVAEEIFGELVNEIIKAVAREKFDEAVEEKKKSFLDRLKGDG